MLWQKVELNVVHMPECEEKSYLVVARDDLSDWVKSRALINVNVKTVAKFFWEDVICRHDVFEKLIVNDESENKNAVIKLTNRYEIKRVIVFEYHSQVNEMIEREHKSLIDSLSKIINEDLKNWVQNLTAVNWVNRITVRASIDYISFYSNCEHETVMLIELNISTWRILSWEEVKSIANLIVMRARKIQRRDENLEEAALFLQKCRMKKKDNFDVIKQIRSKSLKHKMTVLLHDTKLNNMHTEKLLYKWLESYLIDNLTEKDTYFLTELNETKLARIYSENRLKKFHQRQQLFIQSIDNQETIVINKRTISSDDDDNNMNNDLQSAISFDWSLTVVISRTNNKMKTTEAN
jgi:hypothetical protein